jgi:hypothetical protein
LTNGWKARFCSVIAGTRSHLDRVGPSSDRLRNVVADAKNDDAALRGDWSSAAVLIDLSDTDFVRQRKAEIISCAAGRTVKLVQPLSLLE